MFDEETENLPYLSSATAFGGLQRTTSVDEPDLPTLKRVLQIIDDRIALRNSNDSLNVRDEAFTVEQQLAINQAIVADAREFRMLVQTAIDEIKEA